MRELLQRDVTKMNSEILRKLISWATQEATGCTRGFWGDPGLKPTWWPIDTPFLCVSRNTKQNKVTKDVLIRILQSFKEKSGISTIEKSIITTSTPMKRKVNDSPPPAKKVILDDSLSDAGSLFGGLLNTPKKHTVDFPLVRKPKISRSPPSAKKRKSSISPPIIKRCVQELADSAALLTDNTIYTYCRILQNTYPSVNGLQDLIMSQGYRL